MSQTIGTSLGFDPAIFTAITAAIMALVMFRAIAADIDYASRWHALSEQVKALREQQLERLRRLQPKRR